MKTKAAVAVAAGQPLEITEVDLAGPQAGEVLVERSRRPASVIPTSSRYRAPIPRVSFPPFSDTKARAS
jgi:Zn-dependent alcohol dehydrogenase